MTLRSVETTELAVYGYIKELGLAVDIPDVIKEVIIAFAKFYFNWKQSQYIKHAYEFDDEDPTRLIRTVVGGWIFLAMDEVLSLDIGPRFEWEIEIAKITQRMGM